MALHVTDIVSIGAVDKGDNPESWITMFKRKKANAVSVEQTQRDEMAFDVTELPDEAQEHIAEIQKISDDAAATISALEVKIALLPEVPADDPAVVEIGKASDEVQALVAKLRETADEQAEQLAVEVSKRRDSEFIAKVQKDDLVELLGNADEIGPVLRELSDKAPEAFEQIYPAFVAAAQRTQPFLKEIGASEGDADPQAMKAAWISKQKQDGTEKTDADLAVAFWDAHPDAVAAERENK